MALNTPLAAPSTCRALVPYVAPAVVPAVVPAGAVHDLVVTPHPLLLQGQTITRAARMRPGESLAGLLARHGVDVRQPGWCVRVGGFEVPAELCARTRAAHGMLIEAHRVPGKSAIRLLALVALAYFTMGSGLMAGTATQVGGLGGFLGFNGFSAYAINVGAYMLGSMVINKVLPPPGAGSYGGASPGSTYSLQGARNGARQFGPLGLLFGQVRVAPDFAGQPYSWFEGDDQIQYVQLHAGLNVDTVAALQIGETAIESYSGVQITRTGFASGNTTMLAWESVDTIAGGLLDAPTAPGAYVERTSSANTVRLQVDLVGDLRYTNTSGSPQRFTCQVGMEYKLLPSGSWLPLVGASTAVELANSTTKPLRRTISRDVPAGQYAVRMRKLTANETRNQAANTIEWAALKSYQADTGTAVARQVVGVRIKASGQINGVLDQVTWLATSTPCPVWNGSAWVTQATSNPGALILQFARGVFAPDGRLLWGYGKPDGQIDIDGLKAFMVHCTAQGYRFDHWFTEQMSRRDVLEAIAAAGLASVSRHTGKLGVVYMASGQPIEAVVNMGNMKRSSFRVDYNTRATAEEVEVASPERTNAWRPATLRVLAPGVLVPRETARISPAGVTTEAGRLLAARSLMGQNLYGRKSVTWEMDLEHLTVRRWSVVALSHDLTQWGHGGRLHSCTDTAGTITIELDAEVPAGSTPHVGLRLPGEAAYRVFQVVAFTGMAHTLTLVGAWPAGVAQPGASAGNPAMDTLWIFDFKATPGLRLRITDIAPTPDLSGARITAVPEPDEFWTFIASGAYTVPAGTATAQGVTVSALQVTQERLTLNYDLTADLDIAFTASGPYDHAQVWGAAGDDALQLLGETRTTRFTGWRVLNTGTVNVEVRPFDALGRPGTPLAGTHDVVLDSALVLQGNLLPVGELTLGLSRSTTGWLVRSWLMNAAAAAPAGPSSAVVLDTGPDGQPALMLRATSGTGGGAQGGFQRRPGDLIDRTRPYRFAVWMRCSGNTSGSAYLGCFNVRNIGGAYNSNPYFANLLRSAMVVGRWYLWAGYVYPEGYAGAAPGLSGVWDGETGTKVLAGTDYQWETGATACEWRTYQFSTTAAGAVQDWAWPLVNVVDGTEPSIAALLAMSARGRVAWLSASSQVFAVSKAGAASPSTITLTAQAQNLAGSPSFAVTTGTATLGGSGTTRTLAYVDMATDTVTVTMTWAGITDTITLVKLREGVDAVVGLLTNEAHAVQTAADGGGASFTTAGGTFKVFDGLTDKTGNVAVTYSVNSSAGVTISIASTGIYTVSAMSADIGTATLRAAYGGVTIDKVYSIAKSKAGNAGAAAKALFMLATSQVFLVPVSGAASPSSITFTTSGQNLTGSPVISVIAGTVAALGGSGGTRTLAYADMSTDAVTLQVAQDGLTDTITVVKLREGAAGGVGGAGANAVVGLLTNEAHTVPTAADGSGASFTTAGGTFKVFDGLTDKTGNVAVTYSVNSSAGVTISIASTGIYSISAMSADAGTATLRAVYGSVTIDKIYGIAKSKAGADGTPAISASVTRNVVNFTADSTGLIDASQSFATTMTVMKGASDDTSNWTISRTSSDGSITTSISGATVTITGIGTGVETGTVTLTATRAGYTTQNVVVQVGKVKRAVPSAYPVAFGAEVMADSYSAAAATTAVRLNANGTIEQSINGGSWTAAGNWYTPTTTGIGSSFRATDSVTTTVETAGGVTTAASSFGLASLSAGNTYTLSAATAINTFKLSTATRIVTICGNSDATPLTTGSVRMVCYADRT